MSASTSSNLRTWPPSVTTGMPSAMPSETAPPVERPTPGTPIMAEAPIQGEGLAWAWRRRRDLDLVAFDQGSDLREVLDRQNIPFAQDDSAENGVFELAHIAGPGIGLEHRQGVRLDAAHFAAFFGGKARDEVIDEGRDVVFAVAQGRNHDRKDIEAIIQILAEAAGLHHLDHVAIGGGNEPDIDFYGLSGTDRIDLAFLDGAQQFHLHVERQFGDFIEEQGAAIGLLELAQMASTWRP